MLKFIQAVSRTIFAACLTLVASGVAFAADNPLSVHILDLQTGRPTPGVTVDLEKKTSSGWHELASGVTDEQGRIRELFPDKEHFSIGVYRVVFRTGDYFARLNQSTFFPEVEVPFKVDNTAQHYHIPLLLSPYGYSTYRGN